ncbi:hypothetical protein F443_03341 [Phytophthora nicotianae P1569]|uniref:SWIM-type domain-containing protein n=1 Tax=Phytophthora nicotianae P1569 TaxID=1317065 RepID=V9FRQ7_PHYNI|nr:hypothetical protein F443_03341 [Phytophthora nicotianae P1569]
MCTDLDVFFGWMGGFDVQNDKRTFAEKDLEFQNDLIILNTFDHSFTDEDGKEDDSFGFICTSRRIFRHVYYSVEAQNTDGVVGLTDGTYRIDFSISMDTGLFGTDCGVYDNRTYRRSFVPWVYMFVRTEHGYAYKTMFTTTVDFAAKYFDCTLTLKYGNQDRATYIANAYKAIWSDPTFYGNHVDKNIHELELARSPQQFVALAGKCTKFWITKHDKEYASWFTNQYLGERWGHVFARWQLLGVLPSQNPIESHHQALKTVCVPSKHVATSVVCNDTLPSVLYLDCDKPIKSSSPFAEGPIIGEMVLHARIFAKEKNVPRNYERDPEFPTFSCTTYRSTSATTDLHVCIPLGSESIPAEQIRAICSRYQCDCKGFWTSGWLCSHVLAAMSLMEEYDLKTAVLHLPTRKESGGQRKVRNALQEDDTGYFAVSKLEKDL